MRVAILSDIHANREAFDAVQAVVRGLGVDHTILLGDLVGYGPDPVYIVEQAADMVTRGATCILGNHDEAAVIGPVLVKISPSYSKRAPRGSWVSFMAGFRGDQPPSARAMKLRGTRVLGTLVLNQLRTSSSRPRPCM